MEENNDLMNYGGSNAWFWIVIILLFGGGNFFNRGQNAEQVNSDFLYRDISNINTNVLTSANQTQREILDSKYDTASSIANLSSQFAQCCCENKLMIAEQTNAIQQQMSANTQMILDKMCQSEIQNLRDQLAQKDLLLAQSNALSINQAQTQNILNTLGKWYSYPPYTPTTTITTTTG